jgi:hypothetical protein
MGICSFNFKIPASAGAATAFHVLGGSLLESANLVNFLPRENIPAEMPVCGSLLVGPPVLTRGLQTERPDYACRPEIKNLADDLLEL